jgi:hypothetical protein
MAHIQPEPINQSSGQMPAHHGASAVAAAQPAVRPANVDALSALIQREFPNAHIRITGRGRTVQRQAELMADRRRRNRHEFLHTYRAAPHITEMDQWVTNHPQASQQETATAFVEIINRARRNGAVVSNHLSDRARDISIPVGDHHLRDRVRARLRELGAHVIDEADAVGGPHWHIDY